MAQIHTIIGTHNAYVDEDFHEAFRQLEEALRISEEANDLVSLVFANFWLAMALSNSCAFEKSLYHFERALDINQSANTLWGISVMKSNISFFVHNMQGNLTVGYPTTDEAIRIAEESDDAYSKAVAYTIHGVLCYAKGSFQKAIENILKGVDFYRRINIVSYNATAQYYLGEIFFEIGEYQKSIDHYYRAVTLMEQYKINPSFTNSGKIAIARSKVMNYERDVNLESLCALASENRVKLLEGWVQKYIGEILLNINEQNIFEAKGWIQKAIEAHKRNDMMFELGRDYAVYAELFTRKGDQAKAKENLTKAIDIYKECGADGWVEKAEKELASIS
jgi:tetratricopeptide (TPR) repeat protein